MSPKSKRTAMILGGATVAATGVAWAGGAFGPSGGLDPAAAASLEPFDSCEQILEYADEHRWARAPYYPMGGPMVIEDGAVPAVAAAEGGVATRSAGEDVVGPSESGTNVQEVGIDEPDIAKLAGESLFVSTRHGLEAYDVGGDEPVLLDRLAIDDAGRAARWDGAPAELLIGSDRALLIAGSDGPGTRILEVDIADPSALALIRTMEVEGYEISSRLREETAHLVMASTPDYPRPGSTPDPEPEPPSGTTGETGVAEDGEGLEPGWLPRMTVTDAATGASVSEPLLGCDEVSYPTDFAGLGMLSVLTIDLEQGLPAVDTDAVMTGGQTVYASASSLYVATPTIAKPEWDVIDATTDGITGRTAEIAPIPQPAGETAIHRFDVSDPDTTSYSASAEVKGQLLSQFSMSEHDGHLRVAATEGSSWAEGPNESESAVTVLAIGRDELNQVGKVSGLGRGEEIQAVRFIGDQGYVVTFEQTDPLYVIDLGDPAAPRATGELKIPGFSAYLHPVGAGLLLGIGQNGTQDGSLTGSQASLFDVSDAVNPTRVAELALSRGFGNSATEWDHHAFLFAPERSLAVVPVSEYSRRAGFQGAVAMRVGQDGELDELARFEDGGGYRGQIQRMLVVGDRLVTVSATAVAMRDVESFEGTGSATIGD
ncbi:MAG: beta-propeller domain-containing protein [Actinomycetota bacterium]|nr:beta-propeller domain-containing protein [Actinomycetota bacterium]